MANLKTNYHKHIFFGDSESSVLDFVFDEASIGLGIDIDVLLPYEDETGVRNIDNITSSYTQEEIKKHSSILSKYFILDDKKSSITGSKTTANSTSSPSKNNEEASIEKSNTDNKAGELPLKNGTILNLPLALIDRELRITESNQVVDQTSFEGFLARELYLLLTHSEYKRSFIPKKKTLGEVHEIFPHITIWIWSKAFCRDLTSTQGTHSDNLINITPFVKSLNTNVGEDGGSFSIELSPIIGKMFSRNIKGADIDYPYEWQIDSDLLKGNNLNIVSNSYLHTVDSQDNLKRNRLYFDTILQSNDVVFIRFERLELEKNRKDLDSSFLVSIDELPNSVFDMIGFVDNVTITNTPQSPELSITVSGRDGMKLLTEDSTYLYPEQFIEGGLFANITGAGEEHLTRYSGKIDSRFQRLNKTIDRSLKFLINGLANIKITSDTLFDRYSSVTDIFTAQQVDKRSRNFQLTEKNQQALEEQEKRREKLTDEIKELIKKSIVNDQLQSFINIKDEGQMNAVFASIQQFITPIYDSKLASPDSDNLLGWKAFKYNQEDLSVNEVTDTLHYSLFKPKTYWVNKSQQKISSTHPYQKNITSLEKGINEINTLNKTVDNKEKLKLLYAKESRLYTDINNNRGDFNTNAAEVERVKNEILRLEAGSNNQSLTPSETTGVVLPISQPELKKTGTIYLVEENKKLDELNEYAKQALQKMYILVKDLRTELLEEREEKPLRGIWQIVKLVVDESVVNRRIVDISIGNENGMMLNAVRKICQSPFCEFFVDTYGDQIYFIVRKKPFDKKGMQSFLFNSITTDDRKFFTTDKTKTVTTVKKIPQPTSEQKNGEANQKRATGTLEEDIEFDLILTINESDIITDSLQFSQDVYSWYRIIPQNLIGPSANTVATALAKAVYFKQYADIWGARPLEMITNYIPYFPLRDKNNNFNAGYFVEQAVYDLKYLIESHAYLPFTRQGSITINGDRRIKRGTFIKLQSTDEIFYVDNVSHNFSIDSSSIDRTTTLQLSRGMVKDFIKGVKIGGLFYSYFNIIKTEIPKNAFVNIDEKSSPPTNQVVADWKVIDHVFNFFLKRLQFTTKKERENMFIQTSVNS